MYEGCFSVKCIICKIKYLRCPQTYPAIRDNALSMGGLVQMADSWAEVYCGGEDEGRGRWVHIHPLYGWINK